jgi:hypothetical protein
MSFPQPVIPRQHTHTGNRLLGRALEIVKRHPVRLRSHLQPVSFNFRLTPWPMMLFTKVIPSLTSRSHPRVFSTRRQLLPA